MCDHIHPCFGEGWSWCDNIHPCFGEGWSYGVTPILLLVKDGYMQSHSSFFVKG